MAKTKEQKFVHIDTIERRVARLVSESIPEATPEEVDKFRPLLTRLVLLEEQNA